MTPTSMVRMTATKDTSTRASDRPSRNGKSEVGVTTTYLIIR
jgi:hypothetical protein